MGVNREKAQELNSGDTPILRALRAEEEPVRETSKK